MKKIILLLLCINCIGCATLFKGDTTTVQVSSEPQGADVFFNGLPVGKTPVSVVTEDSMTVVTISKTGYQKISKTIGVHLDGSSWTTYVDLPLVSPALFDLVFARLTSRHLPLLTLKEKGLHFTLAPQ